VRKTFIALVCLFVFSTTHAQQQESTPSPEKPLPIIDVHTHTAFSGATQSGRGIAQTEAQYFKEWKEAGIVGAIAHTTQTGSNFYNFKDRNVIYCGGVGPETKITEIESGLRTGKYGCLKIYLGYVHRYASDPLYDPFYKLAEKYDVAVVFHTGDTASTRAKLKYADPLTIDEVAVDHPKVRFVIAHCGNPWIESAARSRTRTPTFTLNVLLY
jgi:hypothetical protein